MVKFVLIIKLKIVSLMFMKNVTLKKLYVVSLFIFFAGSLLAQSNVTLTDGKFIYRLKVEELPDAHYRKVMEKKPGDTITKSLPRIGIKVGSVKSITILNVADTNKKQVIIPGKNETAWPWTDDTKYEKFILEDINFDGYNDIRLLNSADTFGYYCWTFQPATGKFIEDTVLSKFINPQFDQQQKLVYQNLENSGDKRTQIFRYINGVLTLIEEDETNYDSIHKTTTITIRKLINGKMQITNRIENPTGN